MGCCASDSSAIVSDPGRPIPRPKKNRTDGARGRDYRVGTVNSNDTQSVDAKFNSESGKRTVGINSNIGSNLLSKDARDSQSSNIPSKMTPKDAIPKGLNSDYIHDNNSSTGGMKAVQLNNPEVIHEEDETPERAFEPEAAVVKEATPKEAKVFADSAPTVGANKSQMHPKGTSDPNLLDDIAQRDTQPVLENDTGNDRHEDELKEIMNALDRGGSTEQMRKLEKRLSEMSKKISYEGELQPGIRKVGGVNVLTPILEDKAVGENSDESSSEDDSAGESSSSDSDDLGSKYNSLNKEYSLHNRYVQTLKSKKKIEDLHALAAGLPKLKPHCVA
eukprot:CAMPEP_0184493584 /NCGR_PEP_ID=MMETSP0113_2-20130426/26405_1 /TAXON_ID=91329 /ORGANISM="Norrisiella sphaerica, Strain BC52" /LENGTH=332 /DNA_ID=CAMNT_0026878899 /DNA_START=150 /DNA_END=1148 /DNA_ORIENTATION=-